MLTSSITNKAIEQILLSFLIEGKINRFNKTILYEHIQERAEMVNNYI